VAAVLPLILFADPFLFPSLNKISAMSAKRILQEFVGLFWKEDDRMESEEHVGAPLTAPPPAELLKEKNPVEIRQNEKEIEHGSFHDEYFGMTSFFPLS
jgi:hypothetical protein